MRLVTRLAYAILDGTLIPIDRVADQRPYYSGTHKRHGVNVQVLADAAGRLIWASPALPGSTNDLTAARTHGLIDALTGARVMTFADKGYCIKAPAAPSGPRSNAAAPAYPADKSRSTGTTPRSEPSVNAPSPPSRSTSSTSRPKPRSASTAA